MGGGQPYLYNPPAAYNAYDPYNGFNPKRISQASLAPPMPRPKQEGPLLNFNRHPDSYLVQPYGKLDVSPMHKNTKKRMTRARKTQLGFRVLQLIGAIGILVCIICIKVPKSTEGWIVRLPPGVDVLVSLYAAYNLSRNPKGRAPASNASYHGFSTVMDAGLIPFYIFIALLGHTHYLEVPGTKDRWTSLLDSVDATNQLIQVAWLAAATVGALHAISLVLDIFLFIMYRKISQLPPDMNPLEDNLTSRRKTKHKYKNSEVTLVDDKHISGMSGSTAAPSVNHMSRMSVASYSNVNQRKISFLESRTGEDSSFSPHNPKTARLSMYQQGSMANSHANLHDRAGSYAESAYSHRRSPMPTEPIMPKRSSVVSSLHNHETSSLAPNSRDELRADNWFVIGDGTEDDTEDNRERLLPYSPQSQLHSRHSTPQPSSRNYQPVAREAPHLEDPTHLPAGHPLRMNPPTPRNNPPPSPPPQPIAPRSASKALSPPTSIGYSHHIASSLRPDDSGRSKTMSSDVSAVTASSRYSADESSSDFTSSTRTAPSRQLYGDLTSAMRGVRQHDVISPRPKSLVGSLHWATSEAGYSDLSSSTGGSSATTHGRQRRSKPTNMERGSGTVVRKSRSPVSALEDNDDEEDDEDKPLGARFGAGYARVVSRTGVDVQDFGNAGRRREVSGKVAEEGRAGSGWLGGGLFRRSSGMVA